LAGLRLTIERTALRSATVLLEGETGVGKEVAARVIHQRSARAAKPFVPVDCTAFSTELMESQLFGHVKGAFTGAAQATQGFMRCAEGGTLFLDEIGELPLAIQAKLLRSIQERVVVPVGSTEQIPVNIRIVAATHCDLAQMVREGRFRQDLYYRLNVVRLSIPPLRQRGNDVLLLAGYFLEEIAECYQEPIKVLSPAVEELFLKYPWPGNVRELRNCIERAILFCTDRVIDVSHLPGDLASFGSFGEGEPVTTSLSLAIPLLSDSEKALIIRALNATQGNQTEASRILGIERHRLHRKIQLYGLKPLTNRPR
jgi:transcriptional regulator with PAS, ATPase and Fis domain